MARYFHTRLKEIGLPPDAAERYGLREDEHGNVLQLVRTFAGHTRLWIDTRGRNKRKVETITNRKTVGDGGNLEQFHRELAITRYAPENIPAGHDKYKYPSKDVTGHSVYPLPAPLAIDNYNAGTEGGTVVAIEGYFKAAALDAHGVEAFAFTGIATYKLCADAREYLLTRKPDALVIMYDKDAPEFRVVDGIVNSQRVENFYNSAAKFARAFFTFCQDNGLNTELYFVAVAQDAPGKGVDDILSASDNPAEVIAALHSLKTSEFFDVLRLRKTTFERELLYYFALDNHHQFYQRHRAQIGEAPFVFCGAKYKPEFPAGTYDLLTGADVGHNYRALFNPFHVDMDTTEVTVGVYLTEAAEAIAAALLDYKNVCIYAPTGCGKTSFFLNKGNRVGFLDSCGERGVIAVPYISLAKQIAAEYKIPALYGHVTNQDKEKALNAPVVVCTYDTLHHVPDLYRRRLIVDEAHNLVNGWGDTTTGEQFRAQTLRDVLRFFDVAESVVLLSGTPPRLLAKKLGFHYVNVKRRTNNVVKVHPITANRNSPKELTATLLAQLAGINLNDGGVRLVFYNNKEQAERIREHLVATGQIAANDVAIISREHLVANSAVYNGIIKGETIAGAKLILTTCLIAEGVNIKNTNIAGIYTVGIDCPDMWLQFVARFRKMLVVDVYDIRPPEKKIPREFFLTAEDEARNLLSMATHQKQAVEYEHAAMYGEYTADELEFWEDIRPRYNIRQHIYPFAYQDADGRVQVDVLRIMATVRQRMLDGMNNTFFYTAISDAPGVVMQCDPATPADVDAVKSALAVTDADMKLQREQTVARLQNDLQTQPEAVVGAYFQHATETNNRHTTADIQRMVGDLLEAGMASGVVYLEQHAEDFTHKWFRQLIRAFMRLHFIGLPAEQIAGEVAAYTPAEFLERWRTFSRAIETELYDNRHTRKFLSAPHRVEIKTVSLIRKWVMDMDTGNPIPLEDVTRLINRNLTRRKLSVSLDGVEVEQFAILTKEKALTLIKSLFDVDVEHTPAGKRLHLVERENIPWGEAAIWQTPARYIELFRTP